MLLGEIYRRRYARRIAAESVRYCYRRRDRTSGGGTSAVSRHLGLHGAIYRYATLAVGHVRYARAKVVRDSVSRIVLMREVEGNLLFLCRPG